MISSQHTNQRLALIPALLLALVAICLIQPAYGQSSLTNGLVAYYPFDGNANDASGNGNNATFIGDVTNAPDQFGRTGMAAFVGANGTISLPSTPALQSSATTFSFWYQPETNILTDQQNFWFCVLLNSAPDHCPLLFMNASPGSAPPGTPAMTLGYWNGNFYTANYIIPIGQWTHFGLVINGASRSIYINGSLIFQANDYYGNSTYPVTEIGNFSGDPNTHSARGSFDDVRIYNRALIPSEVQSLSVPLAITSQPQNAFALPGSAATFTVGAAGWSPVFYQWHFNSTNVLAGQTNATLTLSNVQPANVGSYSVVVSNAAGVVASSSAFLTISNPGIDDDGDGLLNEQEIQFGTNPLNPDTDGDGVSDYQELFVYGTNPLILDTDGDGMLDGWELQHGLNPRFNDAADDLDGDGLSNLAEYNWNLSHTNQVIDPRTKYSISASTSDYAVVNGAGTNQFFYDRNNRLIGAEFDRGLALAYVYDGNDNLVRQVSMRHDANTNGLPDVWEFLNGLTNNASAYTDTDSDGWSDWQEWKSGTQPTNAASTPNLLGNPGTNIASLVLPFTPSNFVVGVGQLDGATGDEIVLGGDGNPNGTTNSILVLINNGMTWTTQKLDVGNFGVTSVAIGQLSNRPAPAVYVGLRQTGGQGRIREFMLQGGTWVTNEIAVSSNETAFAITARPNADLLTSISTNGAAMLLCSLQSSSNIWNRSVVSTNTSSRGLGASAFLLGNIPRYSATRLLDAGGIEVFNTGLEFLENRNLIPTNAVFNPAMDKWCFATTTNMVWADTDTYFQQSGSEFVVITSPQENDFVHSKFPGNYHIGLYGSVAVNYSSQNQQVWIWSNGDPSVYRNWSPGQPAWPGDQFISATYEAGLMNSSGQWEAEFSFVNNQIHLGIGQRQGSRRKVIIPESPATARLLWRGLSLATGFTRLGQTNGFSLIYAYGDDRNFNGQIDSGDDFVLSEYVVTTNAIATNTFARMSIGSFTGLAGSYGVALADFFNDGTDDVFAASPDGTISIWSATNSIGPLLQRVFTDDYKGAAWHALAPVTLPYGGDALAGLKVDATNQRVCQVMFWPPQAVLSSPQSGIIETAPAAAVLPSTNTLGGLATVTVRLWDAEGNASTPFLQYQISGSTNWQNATLTVLDGGAYSVSTRVAASPGGVNHTVVWNAEADMGANVVTNILLRARASDMTLLGDWSTGTPFQLNTALADNDGMDDSWELLYFGTTSRSGTGDFDGDGFTDYQEYIADTNPTNATSYLRITAITPLPAAVKIDWLGGSNATQYVQRTLSLSVGNNWSNLITNLPPTPVTGSYTDTLGTNVMKFYRIEVTR